MSLEDDQPAQALRVIETRQVRDLLISGEELPDLRSFPKLERLVVLSKVSAAWLSEVASCCPSLKHLELSHALRDADLALLADVLGDDLESLQLHDCSELVWLGGLAKFKNLRLLAACEYDERDVEHGLAPALRGCGAKLVSLSLSLQFKLDDEDLRAICACLALEVLHLELSDPSKWTLAGISSLGALTRLRDFGLETDYGTYESEDEGDLCHVADMLLGALTSCNLDTLSLTPFPTAQGVQHLHKMPRLRTLVIEKWASATLLNDVVFLCPLLRSLKMTWVRGESSSLGTLLACLPLLESLTLDKFKFSGAWGLSDRFPCLQVLCIGQCDAGRALALASDQCAPRLRELVLGPDVYGFDNHCARRLGPLHCLAVLRVESCPLLNDDGLKYLPWSLRVLRLGDCRWITDEGLGFLPPLLTSVSLLGCGATATGVKGLWSRLPYLEHLKHSLWGIDDDDDDNQDDYDKVLAWLDAELEGVDL